MSIAVMADLDDLASDFHALTCEDNERGDHELMRAYLAPLMLDWAVACETGAMLSDNTSARLAVCMHERLAVRDAMIVSALTAILGFAQDVDSLADMATRMGAAPHEPGNVRLLKSMMERAWNGDGRVDDTVMGNVLGVLKGMDRDDLYGVQVYVTRAYIMFLLGRPGGDLLAYKALALDGRNRLARILLGAYEQHRMPNRFAE